MKRRTPPRRRRRRRLLPWLAVGAGVRWWRPSPPRRPVLSRGRNGNSSGRWARTTWSWLSSAALPWRRSSTSCPRQRSSAIRCWRVSTSTTGVPRTCCRPGEYRFEQPMSTVDALDRVIRGDVVTYPVTVIEGLTLRETAEHLATEGFGDLDAFLRGDVFAGGLISDLDPAAESLGGLPVPGHLRFPARHRRNRDRGSHGPQLPAAASRITWDAAAGHGLDPRGLVTLASIVEKEAGAIEERPPGLGRLPQPAGARHRPLRRSDDHLRPETGRHLGRQPAPP